MALIIFTGIMCGWNRAATIQNLYVNTFYHA